jgi:hypothetical protein
MRDCMERPAGRSDRRYCMNEVDFIRQQLASERAHLREILEAVRAATPGSGTARPVTVYLEWARQRLVAQLGAHRAALSASPGIAPDTMAQLTRVAEATTRVIDSGTEPPELLAERLRALLDAWSESLDALTARSLRIAHWRKATHLSADSILEERRLYTAARAAAGLT